MNTTVIDVWYENGNHEEIGAPDLLYDAGYILQDEYVDVSDPDKGVWWVRSAVIEPEGVDPDQTTDAGEFKVICEPVLVLPPDALASALVVQVKGETVLARRPEASPYKCGLVKVVPRSVGEALSDGE